MSFADFMKLSAVVTVLCVATGCKAPDRSPWLAVGRSLELVVLVDTSRVKTDSGGLRVWMRFDQATPTRVKGVDSPDSTPAFQRVEIEEYLDCAAKRVRDIEMRILELTGAQVGRHVWEAPEWMSFDQHAMGAKFFGLACESLRLLGR